MARHMGTRVDVTVDGQTVTYNLGWSMETNPTILAHRGASESLETLYPVTSPRAGSFPCEADPNDTVQTSLMSGLQAVSLVLYEDDSTSHSLSVLVWPSTNTPKSGRAMRTFSFRETG